MPQKSSVYDKIQKVYSIWICPDSRTKQNAITDYTVQETVRTGNNTCEKADYDKLQVIVVTLGHDGISSTDRLIKYLSLLLSDEKPLTERKRQLEDEYRIPMTYDIEEEMSSMCNMGEAIRRKAEAKGLAEGLAEGRAEGKFETLAELVQRKLLSIKDAAEQAGISEVEFCRKAGLPVQQ